MRSWSTFNEPGVFAFSGYVFGSFPPGRIMATRVAGLVVKHMLIAHTKAYNLIKSLPGMHAVLRTPGGLGPEPSSDTDALDRRGDGLHGTRSYGLGGRNIWWSIEWGEMSGR